jgi:hypothetical protein
MGLAQIGQRIPMRRFLTRGTLLSAVFVLAIGTIYYSSRADKSSAHTQSYTIGLAMLDGKLGVIGPKSWMEFVPGQAEEELHYSVLPLGSVISMLPAAVLGKLGLISRMPSAVIVAMLASASTLFALLLAQSYGLPRSRQLLFAALLPLGTWMWSNLAIGSAPSITLGFAVMGQLGAIYFLLVRPRPVIAGLFFAAAYGNRFELLAVSPVLALLLLAPNHLSLRGALEQRWKLVQLAAAPVALLLLTMVYNYARFYSPFELGHMLLPYTADRPGYHLGLLHLGFEPIWINFRLMVMGKTSLMDSFPFFWPTRRGESIFLCSPFLFLLFWPGRRFPARKLLCWLAAFTIMIPLSLHPHAGAYQFGYRYGMSLLPWFLVILLESTDRRPAWIEPPLFIASVFINAVAVYAFHWARHGG